MPLRARSEGGPIAGPSRSPPTATSSSCLASAVAGSLRGVTIDEEMTGVARNTPARPRRRATTSTPTMAPATPISSRPRRSRGGSMASAAPTTSMGQLFSLGSVRRYGMILPILFRTAAALEYFSRRDDSKLAPQQLSTGGLIADLVLCILSLLGAIGIITPYVVSKNSRKLRHSLILGLATSDLASSVIIIISTAFLLAGGDLTKATGLCDFLGYGLAVSIFTQHCWNLCIAVITYMIVVHPLSNFILTIERYLVLLWPIIWIFALAINGVAWGVAGWSNAAGYCGTGRGAGPLFGPIFIFVPRGLVFVTIIVLYTHLFLWLRRSTLFRESGGSSHRSSRNEARTGGSGHMVLSQNGQPGSPMPGRRGTAGGLGSTPATVVDERRGSGTTGGSSAKAASSGLTSDTACKNGGMDLELQQMPVSTLRGSPASLHQSEWTFDSGKEGLSTAATAPLLPDDPISPKSMSRTLRAQDGEPPVPAPALGLPSSSSSSSASSPTGERAPKLSAASSASRASLSSASALSSNPTHATGSRLKRPNTAGEHRAEGHRLAPLKIPPRPSTAGGQGLGSSRVNAIAAGITGGSMAMGGSWSGQGETLQHALATPGSDHDESEDEFFQRMSPRRDARDFNMVTAPREHLNHYTLTASGKQTVRKAIARMTSVSSAGQAGLARSSPGPESPRSARPGEAPSSDRAETTLDVESVLGEGWTWGMAVGGAALPPGVTGQRRGSATPSITLPKASERETERSKEAAAAAARTRENTNIKGRSVSGTSGAGRSHRHPRGATSLWALLFKRHRSSSSSFYHSSSGDDTLNGGGGSGSTSTAFDEEHGVERMGSTLNRQASILMLLYPLAYCLLFSISIGRLIFDLVQNAQGKRVDNTDALHSVARWFVFIQGAWDFAIFSLVERAFRNRMKRRRRREAGEAVPNPAWVRWLKALSGRTRLSRRSSEA